MGLNSEFVLHKMAYDQEIEIQSGINNFRIEANFPKFIDKFYYRLRAGKISYIGLLISL